MLMVSLITTLVLGAGLGAAYGHFNKCQSGACPLTANWRRGAAYGAVLGLLFHSLSGGFSPAYAPPKNVKPVTEATFDAEVLQTSQPVLVDFFATWCGPCKAMAPALDQVAGELAGQMKFVQVNIDEAPELARRYDVSAVPTLLVLRGGKVVDTLVGGTTVEGLRVRLSAALARPAPVPAS
jgi:thioredoxin 1